MENIKVNCYSGHTYAERPVSFEWRRQLYQVQAVEKAWQEPGKRCFLVRAGGSKLFQLCYNEAQEQWWGLEVAGRKMTQEGKGVEGSP